MQHDTCNKSADLIDCFYQKHNHPTNESRRQHALEIIRSGGDIHSVDQFNDTALHLAVRWGFVDVAQLLLEKGINVNVENKARGTTALHQTFCQICAQTELVPMLLYHGADPWIRNNNNETPLDWMLRYTFLRLGIHNGYDRWNLLALIKNFCYYMFDKYTESGLSVDSLLKMADLDLPIFQEIVKTIKEIDLHDFAKPTYVDIEPIFTMRSRNLRLLLDKFDYVLKALFLTTDKNPNYRCWKEFRHENVHILYDSHLQGEFVDWLCKRQRRYGFLDSFFRIPAPLATREKNVYYLLSCGMEIHEQDIETVYRYCGYDDLFKFLRYLDDRPDHSGLTQIIPRLVFDVTGCIQESIEDPLFWVENITVNSELDFEAVLPYYAVRNLKDLCCKLEVKGEENFLKRLLNQPQIPLLVEMARNVFRRYFVQRLGITSARQFYESLELLPISPHHRKIIALETELY